MEINALKIKMSKEEAIVKAKKKNDWLWNLIFFNKPLTKLELWYIEYRILEIETVESKSIFKKMREKKEGLEKPPLRKKLEVILNGSTGNVAVVADNLIREKVTIEEDDNIKVQNFICEAVDGEEKARKLANKVGHRLLGGLHEAYITKRETVYRPFWVAFYGEVVQGNKVRYIAIPADGGKNNRTR